MGIAPFTCRKLGMVGAGMMGGGIALVAAQRGIEVVLLDRDQAGAERGKGHAEKVLKRLVEKGRTTQEKANAILARITRSAVLEVLREDFVRTARAKGVSQRATLWGHVLRNAMIPVITVIGLQFAELLAGTIVVESVFYLPGLGRLIFQSISNRDLIVVRNCVMLLAAMVVIVNFVVDVLYSVIDPRVKASDI